MFGAHQQQTQHFELCHVQTSITYQNFGLADFDMGK